MSDLKLRKTIAIDFDGCLCTNNWPDIGDPNWRIINAAKREKDKGAALILWTCRNEEDTKKAVEACRKWGLEFDAVNENLPERIEAWNNDCRKVGADEYWDDRAVLLKRGIIPEKVVALSDVEKLIVASTNLLAKYKRRGAETVGIRAESLRELLRRVAQNAYIAKMCEDYENFDMENEIEAIEEMIAEPENKVDKEVPTVNVVFVKHNESGRPYIFSVPDGQTVEKGDNILVKTRQGEQYGTALTDPISVAEKDVSVMISPYGGKEPLMPVIGKVQISRFEGDTDHD